MLHVNTNTTILSAALACAMSAGLARPVSAEPASANVTDEHIADAISTDLFYHDRVDSNNVNVAVSDGVATLKGEVKTMLSKRRAVKAAQSIRGVRSVIDKILVVPEERTDDAILSDIHESIRMNDATESSDVIVRINNGNVTLSGTTESFAEKDLAETVVAGVLGVRSIENKLEIQTPVKRPADEIKADVEGRLAHSVWVDEAPIVVSVDGHDVMLTGAVGSSAERLKAIKLAYVEGVKYVLADDLYVSSFFEDEERKKEPAAPNFTDAEIKQAIEDAFLIDPSVSESDVRVRVEGNAVTLTGFVATLAAKNAAERDARHTVGVQRVNNLIAVRPGSWSPDTQVAESIRAALLRDALLNDQVVKTRVDEGVAVLSGEVKTEFERERAEMIAASIPGVIAVVNKLEADRAWTWQPDLEIKEDVNDQLFWSPFVDADDVSVKVDDGIVTLTGSVSDYSEMTAARDNAFEGGAKDVILKLDLES
ncbi:MAG: BON domain-containing protein [Phycisphaerales bacterium]